VTTNDLLRILHGHLPEIRASLTAAQFDLFRHRVYAIVAAGDDARAVLRAVRMVRRALLPLPGSTPLAAELAGHRSAGAAATAVLPDQEQLAALVRLLESVDWPTLAPESAELARAVRRRLLDAPARGADRLTADAATDPLGAGLIRLTDPERGDRYPDFQFDPDTGQPRPVVQRVNRMLLSDQDPWGAADWWLGGNTLLRDAPAALVGRVPDELLTDAARARVEGPW
jgi:hypothetical protein